MSIPMQAAADYLAEFEATGLIERLRDAIQTMEHVDISDTSRETERIESRDQGAQLWLSLLVSIERHTDPNFDPKDVPQANVMPPPSNGVQFPPGVDPKAISDPKARAEYEAALTANRDKADRHRFQTALGRLDERAELDAEEYIKRYFDPNEADRVNELVDSFKLSTSRMERLKRLFPAGR